MQEQAGKRESERFAYPLNEQDLEADKKKFENSWNQYISELKNSIEDCEMKKVEKRKRFLKLSQCLLATTSVGTIGTKYILDYPIQDAIIYSLTFSVWLGITVIVTSDYKIKHARLYRNYLDSVTLENFDTEYFKPAFIERNITKRNFKKLKLSMEISQLTDKTKELQCEQLEDLKDINKYPLWYLKSIKNGLEVQSGYSKTK